MSSIDFCKNLKEFEEGVISQYRKQTPKSEKFFHRSAKLHINGVSHNIRFFKPYPFVTQSASGSKIIDVDQNKYTDYWMGHWSLILGHVNQDVKTAINNQNKKGWMYGTVNQETIKLSEMINKAVPVAEKIRYVTSGTEATMYAIRLARTYTKRKTIAKIDGGWHGYTSDLLKTVNWPFDKAESNGLVDEQRIISLPYNDLEKTIKILDTVKDLACVIVEPVLGGGGCIPASKEYLSGLQEYVHKKDAILILDEIVTGFRFHYGALYSKMNLEPDIITLGKIIGGGLPIGMICGKKEIMQYADTTLYEKSKRAYIGGGTFSANPATMVAGSTTLSILKKDRNKIYPKLEQFGKKTRDGIEKIFDGSVTTTGVGSLFMTHFTTNGHICNARDVFMANQKMLGLYHLWLMTKANIFVLPTKLGAYSMSHTDEDVKNMLKHTENFAQQITQFKDDDYSKAIATMDPTTEKMDLQKMANEAIKKFKTI